MTKSHKPVLLALLFCLAMAPVKAGAQSSSGIYVGIGGGLSLLDDTNFNILGTVNVENEYDPGVMFGGFVGYDFGQVWTYGGVRVEGQLSYHDNDIDVHSVAALGGNQPGSTGDASAIAFMANLYHDFLPKSRFRPYIGFGLGLAVIDFSDFGIAAIPSVMDDDDTAFAWQAMAGASYDITKNITFGLEYRYFSADAELTSTAGTGSVTSDIDYDSHIVMGRLRYRF